MQFQQIITDLYEGFQTRHRDHDIDIRLSGDRIQFINDRAEAVIHVMDYGLNIKTKRFSYNMEISEWDVDEVVSVISERIIGYDLAPRKLTETIVHIIPQDEYEHLADSSCGCAPVDRDGKYIVHKPSDHRGINLDHTNKHNNNIRVRQIVKRERTKFTSGELL